MDKRIIIEEIKVKSLHDRIKKIRIILPKDYFNTEKAYPVLYMHDGQNLIEPSKFSNHSWEVLKTMDEFHDDTKGFIIVGIDADPRKRVLEYSPALSKSIYPYLIKKENLLKEEINPEADEYGEFIVNQLKPKIDSEYRTKKNKENTFIAGASCGGIISLYLGIKYQNIFSCIGAFSSALTVTKKPLYTYIENKGIKNDIKIYMDMGTKENGIMSFQMVHLHRKIYKFIKNLMNEKNIRFVLDKGATHSEVYWAKRFKIFLEFCFKK